MKVIWDLLAEALANLRQETEAKVEEKGEEGEEAEVEAVVVE